MLSEIVREPPGSAAADPRRTLALRANELFGAANAGQLSSFRNKFHNGAFQIWQRGTSFALSGSTLSRTADRWKAVRFSGGGAATVSRQAGPTGSQYCARVQRDSGDTGTNQLRFGQSIESADMFFLAGKKCRLSFYARMGANYSATSAALVLSIRTGTGIDETYNLGGNYATGDAAPTVSPASITLTTSWQLFEADVTLASGVSEATMMFMMVPTGTAGAADYFEIADVQIEAVNTTDPKSTPFERRAFAVELAICQRFFEKSFEQSVTPAQNIGSITGAAMNFHSSGASGGYLIPVIFKTRKRTAPTVTTFNPRAANALARDETLSGDVSSTSVAQASETGCRVIGSVSASSANGNLLAVHWTASAEL